MPQDYSYYFPINTKTACQSKWTWSTIWLTEGTSSSCHRVKAFPVPEDDFGSFHNLPGKIRHREAMLKGEWPGEGCEYCKRIEDTGGWSDRQHNNDIAGYAPLELKDDPTSTHVKPRIVEIFAENTCNFACIYCNERLSSRIEMEKRKFGDEIVNLNPKSKRDKMYAQFIEWLDENVQSLMRLHLLGGETFIQHQLMNDVLEILERRPNPDLQLCIFSNMNPPDNYFKMYIDKIRYMKQQGNIDRFDLTASIDCWGPEAEYIRYGLDIEKFEENFVYAAEQDDWLWLNVNQTVTSLGMRSMPDLIHMMNKYNDHRHIGHYFMMVHGAYPQHPRNFAYSTWEKDFDNIFRAMKTETGDQQEAIPRMIGIQKNLQKSTEHNMVQIERLYKYLDENDRRRGGNWRELFPYLIV